MKITHDVREYAAQKEIDEQAALGVGMKEKGRKSLWQQGQRFIGNEMINSSVIPHSVKAGT